MSSICHIFELKDPNKAWEEMEFETVIDYGDEQYGHFLHVFDDGGRKLLRCKKCGAYVLMQRSEFHSFSDGEDSYYTDWFPVSGPEEADEINQKYGGMALEIDFKDKYLCRTDGRMHWKNYWNHEALEDLIAEGIEKKKDDSFPNLIKVLYVRSKRIRQ